MFMAMLQAERNPFQESRSCVELAPGQSATILSAIILCWVISHAIGGHRDPTNWFRDMVRGAFYFLYPWKWAKESTGFGRVLRSVVALIWNVIQVISWFVTVTAVAMGLGLLQAFAFGGQFSVNEAMVLLVGSCFLLWAVISDGREARKPK